MHESIVRLLTTLCAAALVNLSAPGMAPAGAGPPASHGAPAGAAAPLQTRACMIRRQPMVCCKTPQGPRMVPKAQCTGQVMMNFFCKKRTGGTPRGVCCKTSKGVKIVPTSAHCPRVPHGRIVTMAKCRGGLPGQIKIKVCCRYFMWGDWQLGLTHRQKCLDRNGVIHYAGWCLEKVCCGYKLKRAPAFWAKRMECMPPGSRAIFPDKWCNGSRR